MVGGSHEDSSICRVNHRRNKRGIPVIKKLLAFLTGTAPSVKQQPVVDKEVSENDLTGVEHEKYIKLLQRVQFGCQIAEDSLEGIDGSGSEGDIYEKERVEKYVKTSLSLAEEIQDGFYKSSALQFISDLLSKAGQYDRASKLIEQISEDFIQEKATALLAEQKGQHTNQDA